MRTRPAKLLSLLLAFFLAPALLYAENWGNSPIERYKDAMDNIKRGAPARVAVPLRLPEGKFKIPRADIERRKKMDKELKEATQEFNKVVGEQWKQKPPDEKDKLKEDFKKANNPNDEYWKQQREQTNRFKELEKKFSKAPPESPVINDGPRPPLQPEDPNLPPPGKLPPESEMPGYKTGHGSKRWLPYWIPMCFFFDPLARDNNAANSVVKTVVDNYGACGIAVKPIMKTIQPGSYMPSDAGGINSNAGRICNAELGFGVKEFAYQTHPNSDQAADNMCGVKPPEAPVAGCAGGPASICDTEGAGAATHEFGHSTGKPGRGGNVLVNSGDGGDGADAGLALQLLGKGGNTAGKGGANNGGGFTEPGCASIRGGANINDRGMTWDPMKEKYFKHKKPRAWINFTTHPPLWKSTKRPGGVSPPPPLTAANEKKRKLQEGGGERARSDIEKPEEAKLKEAHEKEARKDARKAKLIGNATGKNVFDDGGTDDPQRILSDNTGGFKVEVTTPGAGQSTSSRLVVVEDKDIISARGVASIGELRTRDLASGSNIDSGRLSGGRTSGSGAGLSGGGRLGSNEMSTNIAGTTQIDTPGSRSGTNPEFTSTDLGSSSMGGVPGGGGGNGPFTTSVVGADPKSKEKGSEFFVQVTRKDAPPARSRKQLRTAADGVPLMNSTLRVNKILVAPSPSSSSSGDVGDGSGPSDNGDD